MNIAIHAGIEQASGKPGIGRGSARAAIRNAICDRLPYPADAGFCCIAATTLKYYYTLKFSELKTEKQRKPDRRTISEEIICRAGPLKSHSPCDLRRPD